MFKILSIFLYINFEQYHTYVKKYCKIYFFMTYTFSWNQSVPKITSPMPQSRTNSSKMLFWLFCQNVFGTDCVMWYQTTVLKHWWNVVVRQYFGIHDYKQSFWSINLIIVFLQHIITILDVFYVVLLISDILT